MYTIPEGDSNKQTINSKNQTKSTEETLHHLAFDNSLQANIIFTVSSGQIITANMAACKLFGYSKAELLTKGRETIFDVKKSSFKKMLSQRLAEGQSTALVTAIKKDGTFFPCQISSAIFTDKGIEKGITTIVDLSENFLKQKNIDTKKEKIVAANIAIAQTKSDVRLAENNEWVKYIAKNSYDVMWDWDIATGEIYVGDSIVEVFGYKVKNNTVNFRDLKRCFLPEEKDTVENKLLEMLSSASKSWKDSFTFIRHDGSVAFTTCRASIVRDENHKAVRMIGALQDISRLQELENKLEEQKDLTEISKAPTDILWEWNISTNEVCIGEGFDDLLGCNQDNNCNSKDWRSYLHPDDKAATEQGLQEAVESAEASWQYAYRFKKPDGSTARVFNKASIFRDAERKAYRVVGIMHDITPLKETKSRGSRLIEDKKRKLTGKIKNVVVELIYHSHEKLQTNFSDYLCTMLQYDYTYLANIFSDVEGVSIQQYVITQKIERVKELIETNELTLTEIASRLQYSSVAHLSNQFKKFTGLTPTEFKLNSH
ncbi:MAG: domain S-box protein [Segetibacter sp.]|nr:domain S-box protein [Segetibacter sp.]